MANKTQSERIWHAVKTIDKMVEGWWDEFGNDVISEDQMDSMNECLKELRAVSKELKGKPKSGK